MKLGRLLICAGVCIAAAASTLSAQDLGPSFRKINDGIFVQSAREVNSTVGIVLTSE